MTTYGTTPVGFVRKPLADLLASIEEKAAEVFGAGVIQTLFVMVAFSLATAYVLVLAVRVTDGNEARAARTLYARRSARTPIGTTSMSSGAQPRASIRKSRDGASVTGPR